MVEIIWTDPALSDLNAIADYSGQSRRRSAPGKTGLFCWLPSLVAVLSELKGIPTATLERAHERPVLVLV